jgi:hypothetical protein
MQRRRDRPKCEPEFDCLFESTGLDEVRVTRRKVPWGAAA